MQATRNFLIHVWLQIVLKHNVKHVLHGLTAVKYVAMRDDTRQS